VGDRVGGGDTDEQALERPAEREGEREAEGDPSAHQAEPFSQHQIADVGGGSAEGHARTDLRNAPSDGVRHHAAERIEARDDLHDPEREHDPSRSSDGGEQSVVRPVRSLRGMTAAAVELPGALREELRERLLALPGVSAAALDVTSRPPGTIEWE